jgi:His-Xaa-Ser repeat protein HxsA
MKTTIVVSLVSAAFIGLVPPMRAGPPGGAGYFRGGTAHFGGGHFQSAGSGGRGGAYVGPGARFSFGARPVYGHPVYVRSTGRSIARSVRSTTAFNRQPNRIISTRGRGAQTSRSPGARTTDRRATSARNHIFARHTGNWHRDWNRRGAHFSNGHWWCFDGGFWIGLDSGYYPWDYYPYDAYNDYPSDYYPGYYADVNPDDYSAADSSSVDQNSDPNVTAVQTELTRLGYYQGVIDGLFGPDTRDALARYQSDQHLAVTGTLTPETLQSLGVPPVASSTDAE